MVFKDYVLVACNNDFSAVFGFVISICLSEGFEMKTLNQEQQQLLEVLFRMQDRDDVLCSEHLSDALDHIAGAVHCIELHIEDKRIDESGAKNVVKMFNR